MYLHHFEKIVAGIVAGLPGGPKDWALPYWRWDGPEGMGRLPAAFRALDKGGLEHLFIPDRDPRANSGDVFATSAQMDTAFDFLTPSVFDGLDTFGGPKVRRHAGDSVVPEPNPPAALDGSGKLENTPHGSMHVAVGRPPLGWMRSFKKAPLDPIFWLHHCNIDRLWEVWIQRDPVNQNPDDKLWLDASFKFHAADGKNGDMTCRQVLNTRQPPLLYEYDDTSDPLPKTP
jgi:tyrosinase